MSNSVLEVGSRDLVHGPRDSFDFCASSIDELHQEFARSVELYEEICRERRGRSVSTGRPAADAPQMRS